MDLITHKTLCIHNQTIFKVKIQIMQTFHSLNLFLNIILITISSLNNKYRFLNITSKQMRITYNLSINSNIKVFRNII